MKKTGQRVPKKHTKSLKKTIKSKAKPKPRGKVKMGKKGKY